jgi:hypothetical protein
VKKIFTFNEFSEDLAGIGEYDLPTLSQQFKAKIDH